MPLLHAVGTTVGCVLALVPLLLPSVRPSRRWPHVVMGFGMVAGHLGGLFLPVAVLALLTAGWMCGSSCRRAETGHHIQDFVIMPILLVLTAFDGASVVGMPSGHAHAGGAPAMLALIIGLAWTGARLIRVLPQRGGHRRMIGQDLCAAGMAASMVFMTALAL